jgi:serine/threonine protein kinase/tetratricopeptide (TPR) repeat protein
MRWLTTLAEHEAWQPPQEFDGYHIKRLLGAGGMGRVYLAHDPGLARDVAIKFIAAERPDPDALERFLIEARAVARIQHPNVVGIYRIGEAGGRPYVACELVVGKSLAQVAIPMPWRDVLRIAIGLAHGLAAAQGRGILHRDIKPANIMLSETGEVKLVDFGVAKLVDAMPEAGTSGGGGTLQGFATDLPTLPDLPVSSARTPTIDHDLPLLTRAGTVLGTPRYLAPELARGSRATLRSDVFSLGVVLYELCTGVKRSFGLDERTEEWHGMPLAAVRDVATAVPSDLANVIDRCVTVNPDDRFASALEVRDALERVAARSRASAIRVARDDEPPAIGEVIAHRYEVLRIIDEASRSSIYEVLDRELDESVALQLLDRRDAGQRAQLRQQIRFARRLAHPNACRVLDFGLRGERPFVTMELLRGPTLRAVIRDRDTLSFSRKIDLVAQVAAALSAAHALGVTQGDLRPERVIVEPQRAVVVGFGASEGSVADDVRACAALGFELLARAPVPAAATPVLPAGSAPASARVALDAVFARALGAGYETVAELAEALAFAARGATEAAAVSPPQATEVNPRPELTRTRVATAVVFETRTFDDTAELDALERIVTELGGTIASARDGNLVALFGATRSAGHDVVRAACAAHALVQRVRSGAAGLHTGRLEVGGGRAEDDAIAQARQLASAAGPGEVIASPATARHLLGRFSTEPVPGGHRVQPDMLDRAGSFDLPPLEGRAEELAQIERIVHDAFEERSPRLVAIVGAPGAGKTRLRLELARRLAEQRDVEWLIACASPLGSGVPFGLLRDASVEWFDAAQAAAAGGQPAALGAARRWLEVRASLRPIVIALDDLQWADDASRELLAKLRRELDQVPVAILVFARAEPDLPTLPEQPDLAITLAPLARAAAREIVRRLAPAASAETIDDVVRRAGGNPFFLEELAHHAAESPSDELPATIELATLARLEQLAPAERRLLLAASVAGRDLDRAMLDAALAHEAMTSDEVDHALAALGRRQILELTDRIAFHHVLIRDVAYTQLDPATRSRIHLALAAQLEERAAWTNRDPAVLLALAQHRDAAGDRRGARAAYRAAGEIAVKLAAFREANLALSRAEALGEGEQDATLLELCGDALLPVDSAGAIVRYESAMDLATAPLARARLCFKLGSAASNLADNVNAIGHFGRGLEILGPLDALDRHDPPTRLVAARLLAMHGFVVGYEIGDHRIGLHYAERAVALFESVGDLLELAGGLGRLAACYLRAGRWEDRLRANLRTLQIVETLGDLDRQAGAHINLGVNYQVLGRLDTALEHTRRGLELCIRCGRANVRALAHNNLGAILCDAGEDAQARLELAEALARGARAGYTRFLPETFTTLAILDLRAGDLAAAEDHCRRALDHARTATSLHSEGIAARVLAGVLARIGGRVAEVTEQLAAAHARLEGDDYERARTWALESKLAARAGHTERAAELRERASAVFSRLGAALDLDKLDDLADVR